VHRTLPHTLDSTNLAFKWVSIGNHPRSSGIDLERSVEGELKKLILYLTLCGGPGDIIARITITVTFSLLLWSC
jgi:hypothetical protein